MMTRGSVNGNGQHTEVSHDDLNKVLQGYSLLMQRALYMSTWAGSQYGGDRNIYTALGYKDTLVFEDYWSRYERQDIAKAIIDRPIRATWRGDVGVMETNDDEETQFETAYKDLYKKLKLKTRFIQVDKLTGIHKYGVLLLGLSDVSDDTMFEQPVGMTRGARTIEYVKAFSDNTAKIELYDVDPTSERYGMPEIYSLNLVDRSGRQKTLKVHYTRILHIVDDPLESELEGTPRLQAVFNRLYDLQKLVGGSAEMYWRGARPGYAGTLREGYKMGETTMTDLKTQVDEFEHDLRRILVNEGIDLKALAQQIADPKNHVDIIIQMISAVTGIPKRILTGSERGELASTQDQAEWQNYVTGRREEFAEQAIVRPFVDRLIELKLLPQPKGDDEDYKVMWTDLFATNDKEAADIGKVKIDTLKAYASEPNAQFILPVEAFLKMIMGLEDKELEIIEEQRDAEQEERELAEEEERKLAEEEARRNPQNPPSTDNDVGIGGQRQ